MGILRLSVDLSVDSAAADDGVADGKIKSNKQWTALAAIKLKKG